MNAITSVARTEILKIINHGRTFAIFFLAIAILGLYYPQPYRSEVLRDVSIAIVDLDNTTSSRQLARDVDASQSARITTKLPDPSAAELAVLERRVSGYLLIPRHFQRDLLHGRQAAVAFYGDASYFLVYSKMRAAVGAAVQRLGTGIVVQKLVAGGMNRDQALATASPVQINLIPLFNPEGGYASYVVPAVFLLIVQQLLLLGVGLLNAPPTRAEAGPIATTAGKLLAYLIPAIFLYLVATIAVPYVYAVPRIGNVWAGLAIAIPFGIAAAALGLLIAVVIRDSLTVQLFCNVIGLPLFFMAGIAWPTEAIPEVLQAIAQAIPSTSGISGAVRINQMGATLSDVSGPLTVLWSLAVAYAGLAMLADWWTRRDVLGDNARTAVAGAKPSTPPTT